jgi:hypothetical protein
MTLSHNFLVTVTVVSTAARTKSIQEQPNVEMYTGNDQTNNEVQKTMSFFSLVDVVAARPPYICSIPAYSRINLLRFWHAPAKQIKKIEIALQSFVVPKPGK